MSIFFFLATLLSREHFQKVASFWLACSSDQKWFSRISVSPIVHGLDFYARFSIGFLFGWLVRLVLEKPLGMLLQFSAHVLTPVCFGCWNFGKTDCGLFSNCKQCGF